MPGALLNHCTYLVPVELDETDFDQRLGDSVTMYCRDDLIPCIKQLRNILFPGGQRWETQDRMLYSRVKAVHVLDQTRDDLTARMVQ